ncbi:hypothetical protein J6590_054956 [Homalodisca vitripennis]|nr:hypothetical protein J6590_102683 [Homalodisca vitripennis]KAG8325933.1 hypothetical protein J6590_054956 [Homalodisca vitripennis]
MICRIRKTAAVRRLRSTKTLPCHTTNIEELQEKILNLAEEDNLDHETSLSLAAEVGSALLTENTLLKQQLHDLRVQKSKSQLEVEDKLKLMGEIMEELKEKISNQEKEITYMRLMVESERILEDIIQQSERDKCCFSTQINNMTSKNRDLQNKIKQLEADLKNNSLREQETTARAYLNSLLKATHTQASPIPLHKKVIPQRIEPTNIVFHFKWQKNSALHTFSPPLEEELAQDNLTKTCDRAQQREQLPVSDTAPTNTKTISKGTEHDYK